MFILPVHNAAWYWAVDLVQWKRASGLLSRLMLSDVRRFYVLRGLGWGLTLNNKNEQEHYEPPGSAPSRGRVYFKMFN